MQIALGLREILFLTARERAANFHSAQQAIDCDGTEQNTGGEGQGPRISGYPSNDLKYSSCNLSRKGPFKPCGVEFAHNQQYRICSGSPG